MCGSEVTGEAAIPPGVSREKTSTVMNCVLSRVKHSKRIWLQCSLRCLKWKCLKEHLVFLNCADLYFYFSLWHLSLMRWFGKVYRAVHLMQVKGLRGGSSRDHHPLSKKHQGREH